MGLISFFVSVMTLLYVPFPLPLMAIWRGLVFLWDGIRGRDWVAEHEADRKLDGRLFTQYR